MKKSTAQGVHLKTADSFIPTCVTSFGQRQLQELPLLGYDTVSIPTYTANQETSKFIISVPRASNFVKDRTYINPLIQQDTQYLMINFIHNIQ